MLITGVANGDGVTIEVREVFQVLMAHKTKSLATPASHLLPACRLAIVAGVAALLLVTYSAIRAQAPSLPSDRRATVPRQASFHAVSYDVSVSLSPADQTLTGTATVELESREPSSTGWNASCTPI